MHCRNYLLHLLNRWIRIDDIKVGHLQTGKIFRIFAFCQALLLRGLDNNEIATKKIYEIFLTLFVMESMTN